MKFENTIPTKEELQEEVIQTVASSVLNTRRKIDYLLEIDANLYTQLGSQRTVSEVKKVKALSFIIYKAIKALDKETGELLLKNQDAR
jgi:hypothetical protein